MIFDTLNAKTPRIQNGNNSAICENSDENNLTQTIEGIKQRTPIIIKDPMKFNAMYLSVN